jgi:hypothetical protein
MTAPKKTSAASTASPRGQARTVIYCHGISNMPPEGVLRTEWDRARVGADPGERTPMAYGFAAVGRAEPGTLDFEQALVAVASGRTVWRLHALRRMIERGISRAEVIGAQKYKKVIEDYPDDTPYPSCLVLGFIEQRPLHVVVAYDATEQDADGQALAARADVGLHHFHQRAPKQGERRRRQLARRRSLQGVFRDVPHRLEALLDRQDSKGLDARPHSVVHSHLQIGCSR